MSAKAGQTPTKPQYYKDSREAVFKRNRRRMWVDGRYISKQHPLHKPGRYKSFGECAFQNLVKEDRSMEGYVYLVANESFNGWVKIGQAIDAEDRCRAYQTSSPFRDYELLEYTFVEDRREAEIDLLELFEAVATDRRGEWF